ncbi:MAG: hypothetical protein K6F34_03145 [Lachnospiraceae bacterium]|nr:hypothetical protein [Lachnospiraceae bacterium]
MKDPKKKKEIKRISPAVIMLTAVLLMLTACGGKGSKEDDPNLGLYTATTAEYGGIKLSVDEAFGGGFSIELKKKGKAYCKIGEDGGNIKWTLDGETFHAEGGGAEFDGTLKDGVMILDDVNGEGITLTLVCDEAVARSQNTGDVDSPLARKDTGDDTADTSEGEGTGDTGKDPEKSSTGKLGDMLSDTSEDVGKWELFTVAQEGKSYMQDELKQKGIESWIQINADGTGRIDLIGNLMDMEWTAGHIVVPDNGEGKREEYRYSISDGFLVLVDENMTLAFKKVEDAASVPDNGDDTDFYNTDAQMTPEFMKRFEGDWHGLLLYSDAQGDTFSEYDGKKCDVVARFVLDEKGNVTPFMANAQKGDPDTYNFRNLTAELDPAFDGMYISGEFLDKGKFDTVFVSEEDGFLYMVIDLKSDNGDSLIVRIGMRRLDAKWTDDDYPRYPDEGVEFYKGKSFEEVINTFGNPPGNIPAKSHVTDWE